MVTSSFFLIPLIMMLVFITFDAYGTEDVPSYSVISPGDTVEQFFNPNGQQSNVTSIPHDIQDRINIINAINGIIDLVEEIQDVQIEFALKSVLEQAKPRMAQIGILLERNLDNGQYRIRSELPDAQWQYVTTERYGLVILNDEQEIDTYLKERTSCEESGIHQYDIITGECNLRWGSMQLAFLLSLFVGVAEFAVIVILVIYIVMKRRL